MERALTHMVLALSDFVSALLDYGNQLCFIGCLKLAPPPLSLDVVQRLDLQVARVRSWKRFPGGLVGLGWLHKPFVGSTILKPEQMEEPNIM